MFLSGQLSRQGKEQKYLHLDPQPALQVGPGGALDVCETGTVLMMLPISVGWVDVGPSPGLMGVGTT